MQRGTALMMVQTFRTPQHETDFDRDFQTAFNRMRARGDVTAAIAQYGRVLSLPIARGNY